MIDLFPFSDDDDESPPSTKRTPGSAELVVIDKCDALFISAEWTLIASVGTQEIARSSPIPRSHSNAFMKQWTRYVIRTHKVELRRLGVDVEKTYVKWGGIIQDLND